MKQINYKRISGLLCIIILLNTLVIINGCREKEKVEEIITPKEYAAEIFNPFIFAGSAGRHPSLYLYTPDDKNIKEIWRPGKEKIIEISYSQDRSSGFFITAAKSGIKSSIPFIQDIKLYVINNDSAISFVQNLANAIQIYARWETNNAFRIFINRMNENNPSQIRQIVQIYNTYGKLFEEQERTFDLLSQGYPRPENVDPELISPGNEYAVKIKSGKTDSLFFLYAASQKQVLVLSTSKKINRIEWSPDLMYAVVELIQREDGSDSDILVYSIKDKKIVQEWNGNTPGTFFIKNNLLVFDRGKKSKSSIIIYDLNKGEGVDTISMKAGCSLRTLLD